MGNGIANALAEEPFKPVRITVANQKALEELGFGKRELSTLKKYFQKLDDERKGVVDLEAFSEKIGIQARFVDRIFDVTNGSRGGRLQFFEFALSMWNFLTLAVQELPHALFACYDKDNNGSLSVAELSDLSKDLQPEGKLMGPKLRQAMKKFDKIVEQQEKMRYEHNMAKAKKRLQAGSVEAGAAGDGATAEEAAATPTEIRISPDFLMNFLGTNPALGQPLHQFHILARQDIFGDKFWRKLRETHRLPLRKEKCEDKKGLDGIRAVREYLMSLYKQSAAAAAQAEEEAEAAIHQDYMDLTDSDEDDVSD